MTRTLAISRAELWHILSHTERLNRHIGLSSVQYDATDEDADGIFRAASARVRGLKLRWREYPFQWESESRYSVVRIYGGGPIERFEGGLELEDAGLNLTKVTLFSEISGRGALGSTLAPVLARQFMRKTLDFCQKLLLPGAVLVPQGPAPVRGAVDVHLLARLLGELKKRPVRAAYADALAAHLEIISDDEAASLRPFDWAQNVELERFEALRTCLHAVKAGILNMRWAMMCPNCRVAKSEVSSLGDLDEAVHCDLCGVKYDLNFDRYVELKFSVHPAVRRAEEATYCIGGPFRSPHILVQKCIAPGEAALFPLLGNEEPLRLRVLKINGCVSIDADAPGASRLIFDGENWSARSARGPFSVENTGPRPIVVALERVEWDKNAVTAARVTMLQEFRDLFAGEVLRPGRPIAVENVTLFFSDLSNSTALYESIGDAAALEHVGNHFDFLTKRIAANQGAVVKTMGDAVMAVFFAPDDAVRAALEIQRDFRGFQDTLGQNPDVALKIGLHHGPALVVNSNDRLDYFGRTVNVAARIASASCEGDFVLSSEVWEYSSVQRILVEACAQLSRFEAKLRGVEQTFAMVRVQPCE